MIEERVGLVDNSAAGDPRLLGTPFLAAGQSVPGSPHPGALCPSIRDVRDQGNARGSLCPQRGRDQDRQTGLRASAAGTRPFPSTPQPGTWWSQPFCCRKAVFWLSGTQTSPRPLFPTLLWHQQPFGTGEWRQEVHSTPVTPAHLNAWHWGAALGRSRLPAAQKADFSGDSTAATINHSLTLLQRLQELLQNGNGSDSVLRVRSAASDEPKVFHTHQLLLSLQSEVFESLLRNQSVVTLYEPPETAALFEKFIRYLYCGGVSILLHQAIPMHQLASKYRVWGLQRGVAEYMRTHLASESSQGHVVGWYHYAHAYSFHQSSDEAADFLVHADLQKRTSEYLIDNSLHLHIIIKPVYHSLIKVKK
nr:BTB/POZ domain-containing protein 17 [Zonotrichia albicollis]